MNISDLIASLQAVQEAKGDLPVFVYDDERAEWCLPTFAYLADGPVLTLQEQLYGRGEVPGNPSEFLEIGSRGWLASLKEKGVALVEDFWSVFMKNRGK